ncbi:MAG: CobW family GTP-binding protein [Gammaproteobacteria bacterium]
MCAELTDRAIDIDRFLALDEPPIPVTVLTGFLGSGKTTVLRHLLNQQALADTAVIVNELGEVALDHVLLEEVSDRVLQLPSGCLCCGLRNDLVQTLRSLLDRATRAEIPAFERVVVETTGIADPAPIVQTMMSDPLRLSRYRLHTLVCTVDAELGAATLARHRESPRQVALADRLLLTKTDRASAAAIPAIEQRLRSLNPDAPIEPIVNGVIEAEVFFRKPAASRSNAAPVRQIDDGELLQHVHAERIRAYGLELHQPLPWDRFEAWLEELVARHGERLLRVKGMIRVAGRARPVEVHGVQHVFHRPRAFEGAVSDNISRLTVIVDGVPERDIAARLAVLSRAAQARPVSVARGGGIRAVSNRQEGE